MKKRQILITCILSAILIANTMLFGGCHREEEGSGIASTSVAICQILDKLEYDEVVGVPETEHEIPERYESIATIGAPMNPDIEILRDINPALILSPKTLENSLGVTYSNSKLDSYFMDLSSIEGMYNEITALGERFDRAVQAQALVDEYQAYIDQYQQNIGESSNILLLMAYPDGFYLVATEDSYVGNLVKLAGGANVYGGGYVTDGTGITSISPEDIVQKNPDKILIFAHYSEESAFTYMRGEFESNSVWQYFDAVVNNEIYYLPSSLFGMSANLYWTEALEFLQPVLYGESD